MCAAILLKCSIRISAGTIFGCWATTSGWMYCASDTLWPLTLMFVFDGCKKFMEMEWFDNDS